MHAYNTQTEHTRTVLLGPLTFPCFSIIASAGASPPNLDTYKPTSKATTPFSEGKDCQRGSDWSHDCMWEHQSMLWWSSAGMLLDTTAPIACIPKAIKRRKFQWKTTLQGQAQREQHQHTLIWALPNSMWVCSLEIHTPVSLHVLLKKNFQSILKFITFLYVFRHWRQPLVFIHFNEI